jgi:hypothetical protein
MYFKLLYRLIHVQCLILNKYIQKYVTNVFITVFIIYCTDIINKYTPLLGRNKYARVIRSENIKFSLSLLRVNLLTMRMDSRKINSTFNSKAALGSSYSYISLRMLYDSKHLIMMVVRRPK